MSSRNDRCNAHCVDAPGSRESLDASASVSPMLGRQHQELSWRHPSLFEYCFAMSSKLKKHFFNNTFLSAGPPGLPAVPPQKYAREHAPGSPARQKVLLREIRPRWHPAGALVGRWPVFVGPKGVNFIASNPLDHSGAAVTTRGRSGGLQIENLRPLARPIATRAPGSPRPEEARNTTT